MYRSVIKSDRTVMQDKETVIIDANAMVARKLEELTNSYVRQNTLSTEKQSGQDADADQLAALLEDTDQTAGESTTDGFSEGIAGGNIIKAAPAYDGPSPEELVEQAKQEIAQIKQDAAGEIEQAKRDAVEAGRKEGYDAGYKQGLQETELLKQEYIQKEAALNDAYEQKIRELEPRFVEVLTGVYEHVLKVSLSDETQLVTLLAGNAIRNIESSRHFLVHVSEDDYAAVNEQKKELEAAAGGSSVTVEVIRDTTLNKNECMVETENGIYDCGLDTQLKELGKQLKLLSYTEDAGSDNN